MTYNDAHEIDDKDLSLLTDFFEEYAVAANRENVISRYCQRYPEATEKIRAIVEMGAILAGTPPSLPDRLGPYRVLRVIGAGGMGEVFEAIEEPLDRRVAVKTIRTNRQNHQSWMKRFFREREALAKLHHTNIVPILAAGEEGDLLYFAMPYIRGATFEQVIRAALRIEKNSPGQMNRPLKELILDAQENTAKTGTKRTTPAVKLELRPEYVRAVVAMMATVADAVFHANQAGVIHRDLKPSNLMVESSEHPWVVDYGLARIRQETTEEPSILESPDTPTGGEPLTNGSIGTEYYKAPEQSSNSRKVVDARTDVWGLGVILFELLSLRQAFASPEMDSSQEPPQLSSCVKSIPRDLEEVVVKALGNDPDDRYPSAQAFADDLRRWLDCKPVSVWPTTTLHRTIHGLRLWSKRNRGWSAAIAITILAVLSIGAILDHQRLVGNAATGTVSTSWTTLPAYTFTPVNPTTAVERFISAYGINDKGQIVGNYFTDASNRYFSFLKDANGYTSIDAASLGAISVQANGINNAGQIVGFYADASNRWHGFLKDGNSYTSFDPTSLGTVRTIATGINNSGQIVGIYYDSSSNIHSFLKVGTGYTEIAPTSLGATNTANEAIGINDAGQIVGSYNDSSNVRHGFLKDSTGYHTIDVPVPGVTSQFASGIDNAGDIVGAYIDASNIYHGYLKDSSGYHTIDATLPGSINTAMYGINNVGQFVGQYWGNVAGVQIGGFLATPTTIATVTPLKTDLTTQGTWKANYGADGFDIAQDSSANNPAIPAYATMTLAGASGYVWASTTTDPRALQKAVNGSTDRIAGTWYSSTLMTFDVNITDGKAHQVALYALDWDNNGRDETIDVIDTASGKVLNSQTISNFQNGVYLAWTLTGDVTFKVTNNGSVNAVVSGLFFGGAPTTIGSVAFVKSDPTTQGTWKGSYGADGFNIAQDPSANNPTIPAYATMNVNGALGYAWASTTTDPRALQKAVNGSTDRIAGTWYSSTSMTFDMNITDGKTHQVSLYALDWDGKGRSERIDVIDPSTGAVLNTQTISSFSGGTYLVWKLTGHVVLKVSLLAGPNAVVSGIFFDPAV